MAQLRLRCRSSSRSKYVASPSSRALDGSEGMLRGAGRVAGRDEQRFLSYSGRKSPAGTARMHAGW